MIAKKMVNHMGKAQTVSPLQDSAFDRGTHRFTNKLYSVGTPLTVFLLVLVFSLVYGLLALDVAHIALISTLAFLAGFAAFKYTRLSLWSLPLVVPVSWVLADVVGLSNSSGFVRYLPALLVASVLLTTGRAQRRFDLARIAATLLFSYGLIGSIYGRLQFGTTNGVLPLIIPLIVLLAARNNLRIPTRQLERVSRYIATLCAAFTAMVAAARNGGLPLPLSVFNHEKGFLLVLGVGCAYVVGSKLLFGANIAAAVAAFLAYPAASYVVTVVIALATLLLFSSAGFRRARYGLGLVIIAGVSVAQLYLDDFLSAASGYFALVGKSDNGSTRERLYSAADERIQEPIFNQAFTRDVTFRVNLSGELQEVPAHNDFLTLAVGGGYVAQGLFVLIFIGLNAAAVRAYWSSDRKHVRRLIVALLTTCNAAAVSAFANPVFMNPGSSTIILGCASTLIMVSTCESLRKGPEGSLGATHSLLTSDEVTIIGGTK